MTKNGKGKGAYELIYETDLENSNTVRILSRKRVSKNGKRLSFILKEVTPEELKEYRMSGISSFVLKEEGKLYHSEIPDKISLLSSEILGRHLCAITGHECRRLSAADDKHGGCRKVREMSTGIEKYPWITRGYETFNTKNDVFCVVTCQHYEEFPARIRS